MKHQYESEILFRLMERDGFNIPSSVPPYESEIKAYLINQVKQAYPKLTDYEAEWLLYNYTKHLPADFPISTVENTTYAHFENVVPFAYQSAILKGQTLVNISEINRFSISGSAKKVSTSLKMIKSNTVYTRIVYITKNTLTGANEKNNVAQAVGLNDDKALFNQDSQIALNETGLVYNVCINSGDLSSKLSASHVRIFSTNTGGILEGYEIIVEGDYTHQHIPFFTGMQSVKMPVLTTTGKNLFDGELDDGGLDAVGNIISSNNRKRTANFIKINPNTVYRIGNVTVARWCTYNENFTFLSTGNGGNFNSGSAMYLKVSIDSSIDYNSFQIEEGSTTSSYEPYKSNILTVNEDITLRSNGGVYDELNLLTGRLTQRIDENNEVLAQEVVKTVELKTVNESGESVYFMPLEGTMIVQSSGEIIQPTFDMSVPVEAITQNLASFIDLETEE